MMQDQGPSTSRIYGEESNSNSSSKQFDNCDVVMDASDGENFDDSTLKDTFEEKAIKSSTTEVCV